MNNFVGRANALVDQGDVEQAEAVFEEALRRLPDNLDSLVGYAWTAVLQQRWVEALQRWRRVLEVYPGNLRARLGLGNALLELGDYDQAEAAFKNARSVAPDNMHMLIGFARVSMLQQHWAEALERWQRVQELYPDNLRARIGMGNALLELGDPDQAEAVFEAVRAISPDDMYMLIGYARVAVLQRRWSEALERWQHVLEAYPDNLRARIGMGNALLGMRDPGRAEAVFEAVRAVSPDNIYMLIGSARAAMMLRRKPEALARWQQVREACPDNLHALMELANGLVELDELEQAEEICLSAQAKWPDKLRPFHLQHSIVERRRRMHERSRLNRSVDRNGLVTVFKIEQHNIGMFAQLNYCLFLSQFCSKNGVRPYFFLTGRGNVDKGSGSNWLDYYFVQRRVSARQARLAEKKFENADYIEICDRYDVNEVISGDRLNEIQNKFTSLRYGKWLFDRYFGIKDHVLEVADKYCDRHFCKRKVLGIHYRGTDKYKEAELLSYDFVVAAVARYKKHFDVLFVATDDPGFLEYIRNKVTDKSIVVYSNPTGKVHFTDASDNFSKGLDALLDSILLSRCNLLVKTPSLLSAWSKIFNPRLPVVLIGRPEMHPHGELGVRGYGYYPESVLHQKGFFRGLRNSVKEVVLPTNS